MCAHGVTDPSIACHENLEALLSPSRQQLLHAVGHRAAALPLYRASVSRERLELFEPTRSLRTFLDDDGALRHSDLEQRLGARGVRALLPSYRSSRWLERWAARVGLTLLAPSHALQRALEHKIRFHGLLESRGLPVPAGTVLGDARDLDALAGFPLVCQRPASEGMEGTFLVRSRRELRALLDAGTLGLPLLCRERRAGLALGVTLVVGARELLLSAARLQCRTLARRERDLLAVQWLASARLTRTQRSRIGRAMTALGRALRATGFRGAASIDLILGGDEVSIIECNPRFSAASPQLAAEPELLHGLDLITEHLRALRGEPLGADRPRLPRTGFEGACVDFSDQALATIRAAGRRVVHGMPEVGIYDYHPGRKLALVSQDVAELRGGPRRLLFHYSTPVGARLGARADLGTLFCRFPLFDVAGERARLNGAGKGLLRQLWRRVRFERPRQSLADLLGQPPGPAGTARAMSC